MLNISHSYNELLSSEEMNRRFADFAGASVIRGFRLHVGTRSDAVSLLRDGDAEHLLLTAMGVRISETDDLSDVVLIEDNESAEERTDVLYLNYQHGEGEPSIHFSVVKGIPGEEPTVYLNSSIMTPIGFVRVRPGEVSLIEADLTSMTKGLALERFVFVDPLELPNGLIAGPSTVESLSIGGESAATEPYVEERLTTQLAETVTKLSVTDQPDFVRDIERLASHKSKMTIDILSGTLRNFSVNIPISNSKGVSYTFAKNQNDDYVMLLDGSIGNINPVYVATNFINAILNGTFIQDYPPNIYTVTINDSISTTFIGTKVSFYTYRENRGGLWEFILDEGTGGEQRKNVSVYSATAETVEITLFENLDYKKHTLKAVFKGQDPANPVATPRGWLYLGGLRPQDTLKTFKIYNDTFDITETTQAMYSYSNKEFAIEARPAGTSVTHQFIPEHNAIGTAFKLSEQQLYADGKPVDFNTGNYAVDVETVQLIQRVKGIHTSDPTNPLMEIITYHTIKNGAVSVSGRIKFLRDTEIKAGYAMMLPYFASFAKKIKTSIGNDYAVITDQPNLKEYWVEGDKTLSFAILNDVDAGEKMNTVVAMTVDNFNRTNRIGETGRGNPFSWIEHRNSSLGKLYLQQFKDVTISAGQEYRFDGRYLVTLLPNVNELLL